MTVFLYVFLNTLLAHLLCLSCVCLSCVCFRAVRVRVAPRTGPAHRVHLLRCRRSGRLQHHRHSHPEIVSRTRTCIHTNAHSRACIGRTTRAHTHTGIWPPVMAAQSRPKCVFALARCQRIPGRFRCQNELVFWSSFSLPGIRPLSRPAGGRLRPRPSTALLPLIRF